MTIDQHIELANLQKELSTYIGLGDNSLVFNFEEHNNRFTLRLITVNPRHNQSFLYNTTEGLTKVDALRAMLTYVQGKKDKENSYTIQWSLQGENNLHTSYFSAKNILGALDKLYYERDPNVITVFNVALNPTA